METPGREMSVALKANESEQQELEEVEKTIPHLDTLQVFICDPAM